jgi:hypothetical protein
MKNLKDAKYQLKALLLRNNINSKVKANWPLQHLRWLAELVLFTYKEYPSTTGLFNNRIKLRLRATYPLFII